MSAPSIHPQKRLESIDFLRGLAIFSVVAIHCPHDAPGGFRTNPWFFASFLMNYGYLGVHLFVLLSGFCIHRRAAIQKQTSGAWNLNWGRFWKRRFWRLYPPYLAVITLGLLASHTLTGDISGLSERLGLDLVFHILMLHNLTMEFATSLGNGALWSLGMEEQLYLGYFLILFLIKRSHYRTSIAIAAITTLFWRVGTPFLPPAFSLGYFSLGSWYLWPFMFSLHWVLGAYAVDVYYGNRTLTPWARSRPLFVLLLSTGLLLNQRTFEFVTVIRPNLLPTLLQKTSPFHAVTSNVGELFICLSFFILLNRLVQAEHSLIVHNPLSHALSVLGKFSYSTYLVHIPVMYFLRPHLEFSPYGVSWLLRTFVYMGSSFVVGAAFYWGVERWFLSTPSFLQSKKGQY